MRIKVCRIEDGPARVEIINDDGETTSCVDVNAGQEVEVAIGDQAVELGEVSETPAQGDPGVGQATGEGAGGEGEGSATGEGEGSAAGEGATP